MSKMIKLISTSILLLGAVAISGCNTVAGFGEDVSQGGRALTQTAESVK